MGGVMRNRLKLAVFLQVQAQAIGREIRVESAGVIQNRHREKRG
jgi:hypothetical protein